MGSTCMEVNSKGAGIEPWLTETNIMSGIKSPRGQCAKFVDKPTFNVEPMRYSGSN